MNWRVNMRPESHQILVEIFQAALLGAEPGKHRPNQGVARGTGLAGFADRAVHGGQLIDHRLGSSRGCRFRLPHIGT